MDSPHPRHSFPDDDYFRDFVKFELAKTEKTNTDMDNMLMSAGAQLKWVGDIFSDDGWQWEKKTMTIDQLTLTGVSPDFNLIVIDRAKRSPVALRQIISAEPLVRKQLTQFQHDPRPILVRHDGPALKVLDGMGRVLAAIRDRDQKIEGYIGTPPAVLKPHCEPHVVYDLLRPYEQKRTTNVDGLIAALRYLRATYANVDDLLRKRFGPEWVKNEDVQIVIRHALTDG